MQDMRFTPDIDREWLLYGDGLEVVFVPDGRWWRRLLRRLRRR